MDKIIAAIQWGIENKEAILGVGANAMSVALLAGNIVSTLLQKTPDGDPSQVTDQMVQDLIDNWPGPVMNSAEAGFKPKE